MVKLNCASVGLVECAFSVQIGDGDDPEVLKNEIRANKSNDLQKVDANELKLSWPRREKASGWERGRCCAGVGEREMPKQIEEMIDRTHIIPSKTLKDWLFTRNNMDQPSSGQIHILVVTPKATVSTI
ncbi:hypothetical protein PI124_g20497 [Phytophthora idaei]|nr:hypothetical protein PI125_g21715 [Phytophthora idaei]KAG3131299.1 hypothetical protein PI126_g20120 [Phytophthora idaei]KAG3234450.1 hypothetical protein PI124_g20497 [Phytophthora idaei]